MLSNFGVACALIRTMTIWFNVLCVFIILEIYGILAVIMLLQGSRSLQSRRLLCRYQISLVLLMD